MSCRKILKPCSLSRVLMLSVQPTSTLYACVPHSLPFSAGSPVYKTRERQNRHPSLHSQPVGTTHASRHGNKVSSNIPEGCSPPLISPPKSSQSDRIKTGEGGVTKETPKVPMRTAREMACEPEEVRMAYATRAGDRAVPSH